MQIVGNIIYFILKNKWWSWVKSALPTIPLYPQSGLWVDADCGYHHLFKGTKHPPLTPFMKPRDVSYLKINDGHEYNLPYPQSPFTHNLGTTHWHNAQWLDVASHMTSFNQSKCIILAVLVSWVVTLLSHWCATSTVWPDAGFKKLPKCFQKLPKLNPNQFYISWLFSK